MNAGDERDLEKAFMVALYRITVGRDDVALVENWTNGLLTGAVIIAVGAAAADMAEPVLRSAALSAERGRA